MKIIRLKLANLASLEDEHEINFDDQPLQHAGLIAITGKTGAGKSTLLDAICLALYHKIPRFRNAKGTINDVNGTSLKIDDGKHILTKGKVKGFAEVEFYAMDQKRYRATWTVSRAYKKVDGKLKEEYSLMCLDEQKVIATTANPVREHILRLVGMDYEQFTRGVLLAQSEVGAFLKATDSERANLLEYLTNSDIFRVISQLSHEKTRDAKQALELKKAQYGHIPLLSAQQISDFEQHIQRLNTEISNAQQQQQRLNTMAEWFNRHDSLQHEMQQQQQQLAGLNERQSAVAEQKRLLAQLDTFAQIRPTFEQISQTEHKMRRVEQQLAHQQQQLTKSADAFDSIAKQQHEQQQHHKAFKTRLNALQPAIQQAIGYDLELNRMTQEYKQKKAATDLQEHQLNQLKTELEQLTRQLKQETTQLQFTEQQLMQTNAISDLTVEPNASLEKIAQFEQHALQLSQLTADLDDFSIGTFREQQQVLAQQIDQHQQSFGDTITLQHELRLKREQLHHVDNTLHTLQQFSRHVSQQHDLQQRFDTVQQELMQLKQQAEQLEQMYIVADAAQQRALQQVEQIKEIFERQRQLNTKPIQLLREKLQPEQPCVVCGSIEHPFVDHAEQLEQALHQVQKQQISTAEQEARDALQQFEQIKERLTTTRTLYRHQLKNLDQLTAHIQPAQQHLIAELKQLQLNDDVIISADCQAEQLDGVLQHIQHLEQQQRAQQQQLLQALANVEQAAQHLQHLKHSQQQQQHIATVLEGYHRAEQQIMSQLNSEWQQAWQQQALATAEQLKHSILQRVQLNQQLQIHQHAVQQLEQQRQQLHAKLDWQLNQYQDHQQQLAVIKAQGIRIKGALCDLLTQHQVKFSTGQAWYEDMQATAQQLEQQLESTHQAFTALNQTHQQHILAHTELHSQFTLLQQDVAHYGELQRQWLAQQPEFNSELVQKCLQFSHQNVAELRQQIQNFEQQLTQMSSALRVLQQQFDHHQQQQPEVERQQLQALCSAIDLQISNDLDTRSQYQAQLLTNSHNQQKQAAFQSEIEQAEQEVQRWKQISDVIGSNDGAKFQRIAQQHHLDILIEYANLQLQPLSSRYQLTRIDDSLGLAVFDLHRDQVKRPVQSLSGGETFLVSLALALAIANMATGSLKLNTLFIDEGFGTLDPDSLHIVMDALDKLQSQGRKVILISHIQELHERIPVKIMVQQHGNGRSKIEVVGY